MQPPPSHPLTPDVGDDDDAAAAAPPTRAPRLVGGVLLPPPPLSPPPPPTVFAAPAGFTAHPGAVLAPGWTVSHLIAAGWQGRVHALDVEGVGGGALVLKSVRPGALLAPLGREFQVGARLNALPPPSGFVRTAGCVEGPGGRVVGIILERLPGRTLEALLADPGWVDAARLAGALRAVFSALAVAQGCLGFSHNDLRSANVMVDDATGAATVFDAGLASFGETFPAGPDTLLPGAGRPPRPRSPRRALLHRRRPRLVDAATLDSAPSSPLEAIHAAAWKGRSDAYHLLLDLAGRLDGRVWPADAEPTVERLHDLVAHVCGIRPRGFYARGGGDGRPGAEAAGDPSTRGGFVAPPDRPLLPGRVRSFLLRAGVGVQGRRLHILRRAALRLSGWTRPRCAALTAAEALQAPLFTGWVSWRVRAGGG